MPQHPTKPLRHVIITGGAGFIGSQLSARLIKGKTRVTILTRNPSAPRATRTGKGTACHLFLSPRGEGLTDFRQEIPRRVRRTENQHSASYAEQSNFC